MILICSIYDKLVDHFGIDELGSNFPKSVYDPHGFSKNDYYERLAELQKIAMDKLEKEKQNQKAPLKKEVALPPPPPDNKGRKSKWDIPNADKDPKRPKH